LADKIRHVPDVGDDGSKEILSVVIRIRLDTEDPPTGAVSLEAPESPTLPFVGWLGLLRVLAQLFSPTSE